MLRYHVQLQVSIWMNMGPVHLYVKHALQVTFVPQAI